MVHVQIQVYMVACLFAEFESNPLKIIAYMLLENVLYKNAVRSNTQKSGPLFS